MDGFTLNDIGIAFLAFKFNSASSISSGHLLYVSCEDWRSIPRRGCVCSEIGTVLGLTMTVRRLHKSIRKESSGMLMDHFDAQFCEENKNNNGKIELMNHLLRSPAHGERD